MGVRETVKRAAGIACSVLIACASALTLFLPFPKEVGAEEEYLADFGGYGEHISYAEAFALLEGVTAEGDILLSREGNLGTVQDTAVRAAVETLNHGSLLELITLNVGGATRLGRAALLRAYADTVYYAGEPFRYAGGIVRGENAGAKRIVLLDGTLPSGYLPNAEVLEIRGGTVTASDLIGRKVRLEAAAPYSVTNGALLLATAGGRRLIAAEPESTALSLTYDFADMGALRMCNKLETLTVPFAGDGHANGEFAILFADSDGYFVPVSLRSVKITGGKLVSSCFYGCPFVEQIDVCGLDPLDIAPDAFYGIRPKLVHTPREVSLGGEYQKTTAPCGCTVYTRSE